MAGFDINTTTGESTSSDGDNTGRLRLGKLNELVVSALHGKYAESMARERVFWACMSAGVIFPAPGATAANPFSLYNPSGSGVRANLISLDQVMTVIPGTPLTGLYGLYANTNLVATPVTGTAIVPIPGLIGSSAVPKCKPFSTSTVPVAPTLIMPYGAKATGEVAAAGPITGVSSMHVEFDGKMGLKAGAAVTPQQTVADTANATVIVCVCWEEIPE